MSAFMCSLFYIYTIYAVNYYRKEIISRSNDIPIPYKKIKAPLSVKSAVLRCIISVLINIVFQIILGNENLIIANIIPIMWSVFILKRYEKN